MLNEVEKNDNIINYERKKRKMSRVKNRQKLQNNQQQTQDNQQQRGFWETLKEFWIIIVGCLGFAGYVISSIASQGKDIQHLSNEVSDNGKKYDAINNKLDELSVSINSDRAMIINLNSLSKEKEAYNIVFKDDYNIKLEGQGREVYLAAPTWNNEGIIASDLNGSITYRAEDLYNTPVLTSYMEGDNEVYFYGKFNDKNHWNGCCILNVYSGDKLLYIFEGIYDDGELFSYKRVSSEKIIGEDNVEKEIWLINKRVVQKGYNSGETWSYEKDDDFIKSFTTETVKEKQIFTVDKFIETKCEKLLSYYKGNTSNGTYNDKTGNAYLVNYKDDGNVRRLYKGNFKNGDSEDNTGKAWTLSWGKANDGYHYHNGEFKGGEPIDTKKDWKYPVEQEFINSIVNPDYFNCPLTGLVE